MKKILIISLAYYPHVGGAEVAIKEITDRVSDIAFHMVTLRFNRSEPREEQIGNVLVHRIGLGTGYLGKILFVPLAALAIRKLHMSERFDGAWAMMSYMVLPLVLLRLFRMRLPYSVTLQEGDPFEHVFKRARIRLVSPLLSYGFRKARVIQTISTYLAGWVRSRRYKGPIEVIPNGVDTKAFLGEPVLHEGTVLITTSRLVHKNGLDTVIRALPLLPDVHFRIIGTGPEEASLRHLAQELGVAKRVEFVGFKAHSELPAYLHQADIFIRPSRSEGMGNSFVEAFAAGIPVVATQEGGIADLLFDAKRNPAHEPTGYAVDVDSPDDIARAVREIIENPHEVLQVVAHARRFAASRFEWDTIALDMRERVFAKVLQNKQ